MARKLEYRVKLDPADREALLALPHKVRTVESHHYIVRQGDRAEYTCVMLAGFSIRHKIVASGFRQILAIHMRGEMVDLQNSLLETADHSVQMLTTGKIAVIPREEIERIALQRPAVRKAMSLDTLVDESISREWIANIGRRDARIRVAHLLCEFGLRLEHAGLAHDTTYTLPMTQEQLADATGLTPVHVNRTLKGLEAEGLISRSSPRAIHIGNWKHLADAGDFDAGYLHMKQADPVFA
jgi:CRP-like cAMP-binding protein